MKRKNWHIPEAHFLSTEKKQKLGLNGILPCVGGSSEATSACDLMKHLTSVAAQLLARALSISRQRLSMALSLGQTVHLWSQHPSFLQTFSPPGVPASGPGIAH